MREIAPFGVRMPPELKERLNQQALSTGRSMNTEVVARLWASLEKAAPLVARSPAPDPYIGEVLTPLEKEMLHLFRALTIEKRAALLTVLKK